MITEKDVFSAMLDKAEEAAKLKRVNEELSKLDEVQCEYYFDMNDNDAPVFIYHQDVSFTPLFILRPKYHSALEVKNELIPDVEEYTCWEDACLAGTKDNEYIMKYYNNVA